MSKPKLYKNPGRNQPLNYKSYVPNYVQLGITPEKRSSNITFSEPNNTKKVPFAEAAEVSQGQKTWSTLDMDTVFEETDVEGLQPKYYSIPMGQAIDNNDTALSDISASEDNSDEGLLVNNNEYVLMINGEVIDIANQENVTAKLEYLIFEKEISPSDIILLKRIDIRVGVFVD